MLRLSQQLLLPLKENANRNMASDSHCSWVHSNACCSRQYIAGLLFPASLPCCSKDQEEASSTHATLEASEFPSQEAPPIAVMLSLRAHRSGQTLLEVLLQEGGQPLNKSFLLQLPGFAAFLPLAIPAKARAGSTPAVQPFSSRIRDSSPASVSRSIKSRAPESQMHAGRPQFPRQQDMFWTSSAAVHLAFASSLQIWSLMLSPCSLAISSACSAKHSH